MNTPDDQEPIPAPLIDTAGDGPEPLHNGEQPASPADLTNYWTGLTKRELFAAMAMQGMVQLPVESDKLASWSVECADALLAELERKQ
jgi:hypothetical protein